MQMTKPTLEERIQLLEDRAAIKYIVDEFSNLADRKDVHAQTFLFTEDAIVETYFGENLLAKLNGRKEIEDSWTPFLATFTTVYHMNGQQTVEINGDAATSDHYCMVVLISEEGGKKVKNTNGVIYRDDYVRKNGKWLISKRVAHFTWRDFEDMGPAAY